MPLSTTHARCILVLSAVIGVGVWGCAPKAGPGKGPGSPLERKVAMVTDAGGIDDRSFNAAAWDGMQRAQRDLGFKARYLESREMSDYKMNLSSLADQGSEMVFAIGYLMVDALKEVAPKYPNTKFVIIDGEAPALPNCLSVRFREEEGALLAGYLAMRMSKTGAIGFVGGMEGPLIKKFEVGYRAGAKTARMDARVIVKYVGNWTDVPKGKEIALAQIEQGADVLFHAAGKGGLGVLDAAAEAGPGHYGIGVDKDQDGEHPGRVLTSMMKGVDEAVHGVLKDLSAGSWKPGERVLGLKEGGIRLSPMTHTKKDVPADVLQNLETLKSMIASKKVIPPATEEESQNFQPPKL